MFKPVRVVATILLFASVVMCFVSAFVLPAILCIVFVIVSYPFRRVDSLRRQADSQVQYLAFLWVSLHDSLMLDIPLRQVVLAQLCALRQNSTSTSILHNGPSSFAGGQIMGGYGIIRGYYLCSSPDMQRIVREPSPVLGITYACMGIQS